MRINLFTLLANLALTLSFIAALIFGITNLRAARRDRRERFTLETLRAFQTRDFAQLIQFILSHEFPSSYEGFQSQAAEDQTCFIQFAQEMESIGILVAEHFIDIDLLNKALGVFVSNAWEKYKPMFLDMRDKVPDPFLGDYFQWLAERTEERMRDNPRRPFYGTKIKAVAAVQRSEWSRDQSSFMGMVDRTSKRHQSGSSISALRADSYRTLPGTSLFRWLQ
jgi:hypothetical protein